jgi:putative phosphoribosyl transferase
MHVRFADRHEAGRRIAERLAHHRGRPELTVLALPRGGVPVAREIAHVLHAPLDVLVVRKLGLPGEEEFAFGALAAHGLRVINRRTVDDFGLTPGDIDRIVARQEGEIARRERTYREGRGPLELRGRIVLLVDDGVATGATMRAAIAVARAGRAARIVVAAPVVAREAYLELRAKADEFVALHIPKEFSAVGEFYADFSQLTDEEVCDLLAHAVH